MNGNAASDLVLAIVCTWIVLTRMGRQPGLALSALLIGLAAGLGALWFGGFQLVTGPYRFLSLLSACAGFPLLAWSLRWPDDPFATKIRGAVAMIVLVGGIGVGASLFGIAAWTPAIAAVSALLIVITMVQRADLYGVAGAGVLIVAMIVSVWGSQAPFNATVVFHLALAAALGLFAKAGTRYRPSISAIGPDQVAADSSGE